MRPFAHLDYLYLEVSDQGLLKHMMADKTTQCDEIKEVIANDIKEEVIQVNQQEASLSAPPSLVKKPPQRPPPPKLTKSFDECDFRKISEKKSEPEGMTKTQRDLKIKKKFNTLKENTTKFTKNVYKKMTKRPVKSHSLAEDLSIKKDSQSESKIVENHHSNVSGHESSPSLDIAYRAKSLTQMDKCRSLNHKSAPPRITKSVSSVMSLEDILAENESILSKYPILSMINDYLLFKPSSIEIPELDQYFDSCLDAFTKACQFQVSDTINDINDRFSHFLDLDSIGLLSHQPDLYTVFCIPGWKQIRIIEETSTKEKFISLKNSYSQSWILINQKKINLAKRWIIFPIHSINTLDNEVNMSGEDVFLSGLLKMIMLTCIKSMYDDEKFPKNIDLNTILLISSKCGIIVAFKECLNESEIFSLKFLECDSYDNLSEVLHKSRLDTHQNIANFFQRPEIISILISSTWPLDYLALVLAELVLDKND